MMRHSRRLVLLGALIATAAIAAPVMAQEPPLFPKHRRGLYINRDNLEVVDATPQSPPLETDDPSVPDEGEYEINLLTEADFAAVARKINVLTVDANYGLVLKGLGHRLPTQLKFEFPVVARQEHSEVTRWESALPRLASSLTFTMMSREDCALPCTRKSSSQLAAASERESPNLDKR